MRQTDGNAAREMELKCVRSLSRFVQKHSVAVIVMTILLTVLAALSATRITVSTAVRDFFPSTDPEIVALDHIDEIFGGSEYVLIAAEADDVFTPEGLQALQDITQGIEDIDGVHSVRSVTNMVEVQGTPWGLEAVDLLAEMPTDQGEADAVRRRMEENSQIAGVLLSDSGRYTLALAQLDQESMPGQFRPDSGSDRSASGRHRLPPVGFALPNKAAEEPARRPVQALPVCCSGDRYRSRELQDYQWCALAASHGAAEHCVDPWSDGRNRSPPDTDERSAAGCAAIVGKCLWPAHDAPLL